MADTTIPDVADKLNAPPAEGTDKVVPEGSDKQPDTFMLDFSDKEKAEEGFKNLQAKMTEATQSNAELRRDNERMQAEVLGKMTEVLTRKPAEPQSTPEENEARWEAQAEEFGVDKKLLKHLDIVAIAAASQETRGLKEQLQVEKDAREELARNLTEYGVNSDPLYQSRKDDVDMIVEKTGVTKQQALAIVELMPTKPTAEDGDGPPGVTGGNQTIVVKKDEGPVTTDAQKAELKKQGFTDEEIATVR